MQFVLSLLPAFALPTPVPTPAPAALQQESFPIEELPSFLAWCLDATAEPLALLEEQDLLVELLLSTTLTPLEQVAAQARLVQIATDYDELIHASYVDGSGKVLAPLLGGFLADPDQSQPGFLYYDGFHVPWNDCARGSIHVGRLELPVARRGPLR